MWQLPRLNCWSSPLLPSRTYWCHYHVWHNQVVHWDCLLHDLGISTGSLVVRIFGYDYFFSNTYCLLLLIVFWIRLPDSSYEIWYLFKTHFTKKKLLYTEPQLLRQCKFCNCHHGRQLTVTQSIVCYNIVCLLIQPPNQDILFLDFVILFVSLSSRS